jgi:hypothetical protein
MTLPKPTRERTVQELVDLMIATGWSEDELSRHCLGEAVFGNLNPENLFSSAVIMIAQLQEQVKKQESAFAV